MRHHSVVVVLLLTISFLLLCINCSQVPSSSYVHVNLGILSPVTGNPPGYDIDDPVSVYMAIADINRFVLANVNNNATALALAKQSAPLDLSYLDQPFLLSAIMNDTSVSASISAVDTFLQIYENHVDGIIGSTDSSLCESVATMAKLFNVPNISPECTSPVLSDMNNYPTFFRTVPSDDLQANALALLVKAFGWNNVAIISTNDDYGLGVSEAFQKAAGSLGINIVSNAISTFYGTYEDAAAAVAQVQSTNARIILLSMTTPDSINTYQALSAYGMLTDEYVYIGPDGMYGFADFGNESIAIEARGLLTTIPYSGLGLPQHDKFMQNWLNMTVDKFPNDIQKYIFPAMFKQLPLEDSTAQAYDATLMYAVAINRILKRQAENGADLYITGQLLVEEFLMPDFNFTGISGPVRFNGGDRISNYEVYNLNYASNEYVPLGVIEPTGEVSEQILKSAQFHSGSNIPPADLAPLIQKSVNNGAVIFVNVLMALECLWVLICLIFTFIHQDKPVFKASSPSFLLVIGIGVLLGLSCVPLLSNQSNALCRAYPFVLGVAYVLIFSALFIKTHRVSAIFNQRRLQVQGAHYRTNRLLILVAAALLLEVAFNLAWIISSPDQMQQLSTGGKNEYFVSCGGGDHYNEWLITSYSYKGAALVWGVYLAISVRSVFSYFNESKYVISCIFIVAFTCMIVPAAFYTSNSPTVRFILECLWILVLGAYIPAALWLPKMHTILYDPDATGAVSKKGQHDTASPQQSNNKSKRGPRLVGAEKMVAPGVKIPEDSAKELTGLLDEFSNGMKANDLSIVQRTIIQAVRASGLMHSQLSRVNKSNILPQHGRSSSCTTKAVANAAGHTAVVGSPQVTDYRPGPNNNSKNSNNMSPQTEIHHRFNQSNRLPTASQNDVEMSDAYHNRTATVDSTPQENDRRLSEYNRRGSATVTEELTLTVHPGAEEGNIEARSV